MGHPHFAKLAGAGTKWVVGKFLSIPEQPGLERHPGAALEMIRVAYRERETLSPEEASQFATPVP